MPRPRSNFLSCLGTLFAIFQKIVNEFLALGGTDEQIEAVNTDTSKQKAIAKLLAGKCGIVEIDDSKGRAYLFDGQIIRLNPWFNAIDQREATKSFFLGQRVEAVGHPSVPNGAPGHITTITPGNINVVFFKIGMVSCHFGEIRDPRW